MKKARDSIGNMSGAKELLNYFNNEENSWSGPRESRYTTTDFIKRFNDILPVFGIFRAVSLALL